FIGVHLPGAVDPADIRAHYVHAHATPRDVRDFLSRAESRLEDQVDDLAAGPRRDLLRRNQTTGERLGLDFLQGDATAIIGNPDDNAVSLLGSLQPYCSLLRLAGRPALLGCFQAVINRVSDEMDQRV